VTLVFIILHKGFLGNACLKAAFHVLGDMGCVQIAIFNTIIEPVWEKCSKIELLMFKDLLMK